jgi:uncharacterized repeat protein (TIGR02543 family)
MKLRIVLMLLLLSLSQAGHAQMMMSDNCMGMGSGYGMGYGMGMMGMNCNMLNVAAMDGGSVTSSPAGIACPGKCSGAYMMGSVTLTAAAKPGYVFTGWNGDCSGMGACTVTMDDTRVVTASFAASSPAIVPQTGFWYNPNEGGRGYVIEVHSNNNLFIGGFMYDAMGNAVWYSSGPGVMSGSSYTGTWQQYGNGETLTGSFKTAPTANADVGNITLTFQTPTTGTLTLPDGRQIPITRYPF